MKRPESRKGLKRPATAAESQPVLEEPPAPSAGSAEAVPGHRAEAPDAPQFDHYGCSKCKKNLMDAHDVRPSPMTTVVVTFG